MSNTPNTIGSLTVENKTFYDRVLLKRLLPNLVLYKYGQKRPLPKREGGTVNFRRFNSLNPATTPLTEGQPGNGSNISISQVNATPQQYGDYGTFTDKLDLIGIDPVLTESSQVFGEQAANTVDQVIAATIFAGTNVLYTCSTPGRNNIGASDVITGNHIRRAVRTLKRNNVKPMEGGFYIGIIHPDVAYDIMSDSLWQDVSKYNGGTAIIEGEIGKIHGVRFIETTNAKKWTNTSSIDVYGTLILGEGAYGVVDVESQGAGKPELIIKARGSAGTADPLDQISSIGWKCFFTAVRLQELAAVRIESAATAQVSNGDELLLAALTVGANQLTPSFDPSITSYTLAVSAAKAVVTAVAANSSSSVALKLGDTSKDNGSELTFSSGSNTVTATVTDADSNTKTYTVTVTYTPAG